METSVGRQTIKLTRVQKSVCRSSIVFPRCLSGVKPTRKRPREREMGRKSERETERGGGREREREGRNTRLKFDTSMLC